jgi:phosphoserine phosphatase
MRKIIKYLILAVVILITSCNTYKEQLKTDPLPSWNETQTKQNIIGFVESVTDANSSDFIEHKDRIATFDNDGTLWSEQPYYFQIKFAMDQIKAMAPNHLEWEKDELFQAALNDDIETILHSGEKGLVKLMMTSHAGMSTDEFVKMVEKWISTEKHPRSGKLYKEMIYQPMLENIDYLQANEFKTFLVSGGGIEFMRVWAEEAYGIPKDQIIGSSIKTEFVMKDGKPEIIRLPEVDFYNDKEGKPLAINQNIGRKPVFASGNSDGDLQMLQWTASSEGKRFMLYLHHTDKEREWAYDRESHIGKLDKGLDEAMEKS